MDPNLTFISTIGLALGAAWVSGVRLYGCVAALGWLSIAHLVVLPGSMASVANPIVTYVATALFVVEFFADKIPWLDSGWHAVHTFLAIPAGAVLASSAFAHYDQPWIVVVAFLLGGGVAATSHSGKMATRAVLNMSPEPVSNVTASLAADVSSPLILAASIWMPVLAIVLVICLMGAAGLVIRKVLRMRKAKQTAALQPEAP